MPARPLAGGHRRYEALPSESDALNQAATTRPRAVARLLAWLNWPLVVLLSLAGALLAGAYVYAMVPVRFTSEASLLLNDQPDTITSLLSLPQGKDAAASPALVGMLGPSSAAQRFEQLVRSRALRRELVQRHGLARRFGTTDRQAEDLLRSAIDVRMLGRGGALVGGSGVGMAVTATFAAGPRLDLWLKRPVPFRTDEARDLSAKVANEAVAFLDTYTTTSSVGQARDTLAFVEKRRQTAAAALARTEERLRKLQQRHRFLSPESTITERSAEVTSLQEAHQEATVQVRDSSAALRAVRARLPAETTLRVESQVTSRNPMIVKLESELLDLQSRLDEYRASGATVSHPEVAELQEAVAARQARLKGLTREVQDGLTRGVNPVRDALASRLVELQVTLAGARGREQVLSGQLDRAHRRIASLPPVMQDYARLTRQAQLQSDLLATLVKRLEMARIEERRESSGRFQVLDAAEPPLHKSGPSTVRAALATFLGLLVLLSLANAYRLGWISLEEAPPPDAA